LRSDQVKDLARWGARLKLQAEQEQVLYHLRKRGVNLGETFRVIVWPLTDRG